MDYSKIEDDDKISFIAKIIQSNTSLQITIPPKLGRNILKIKKGDVVAVKLKKVKMEDF